MKKINENKKEGIIYYLHSIRVRFALRNPVLKRNFEANGDFRTTANDGVVTLGVWRYPSPVTIKDTATLDLACCVYVRHLD